MRTWKEQLNSVGVFDSAIHFFGIHENGNGVKYHCEYPPRISMDGEIVWDTVERTRTLPDALITNPNNQRFYNPPSDKLPNGEMPLFYTPHYQELRQAVSKAGGVLHLFEGDKDTWTAYQSGITNVAGILSAGARIDERIATQFKDLGVKTIRYFADNDNAGWSLAEKLADIIQHYNIDFKPCHVPYYVNGKPVKDTSDAWMAVHFNVEAFHNVLVNAKTLLLPNRSQISVAGGDYFTSALYTLIESELKIPSQSWGSSEWSINVPCPNNHHEQDTQHPAFGWNRKKRVGRCFKCGETFLAKDVAEALGIDWRNYIAQSHQDDTPPSIILQPKESDIEQKPQRPMLGQGLLSGYRIDPAIMNAPPQAYTFTMRDALDDYEKRIKGVQTSEYPPIINPMTILHRLGGLAHVLTRPVMVGILGLSGGFKCVVGSTRISTENGLVPIDTFANGKAGFSELGIKLLTPDGVKVASHFYDSGVAPTKRVVTRFGYELQGTYNHPVKVLDPDGNPVWRKLSQISVNNRVVIYRSNSIFGTNDKLGVKEAYSLGVKLGDKVPDDIWTSSHEHVVAFLQAVFSDIALNNAKFSTTNAELAKDIQLLLLQIGIISNRYFVFDKWSVKTYNLSPLHPYLYDEVVSIEDAGEAHCYDVSVPDGHAFVSNGFVSHNTSSVSSIMNRFSLQGYHGIVFSPEWSKQRHADRAVQQFGGLKMPEVSLTERYWYEKSQVESGSLSATDESLFGEMPAVTRMNDTYRALNVMRNNLKGEIVYINKFGASVHDVLAMLIQTYHWMTENGMPPSYFIFDYAQLARSPKGARDWTPADTVTEIKAVTVELGLATFVTSQVRKTDYGGMSDGKMLDATSGKFVNDTEFNLFWTTNPTDGYVVRKDGSRIKEIKLSVTKNSDGNTADKPETAISVYADLNRMVILDRPDGGDPIMDIMQADLDELNANPL